MKTFIPLPVISQNIPIELRQFCQNVLEYLRNLRQELAGFFGQGEIDATTGAEHLILQPNGGNVGIGTTSPNHQVESKVSSGAKYAFSALNSAGTQRGGIYIDNNGDSALYLKATGKDNTLLNSNGSSYLMGGNIGIGTIEPTASLDINSNKFRLRTAKTPASASDTGNAGDICWDSNYIYVCVATNTWKRVALSTW